MKIANNWKDYKILDMAEGQKLERWGDIILSRPDPQIIWKQKSFPARTASRRRRQWNRGRTPSLWHWTLLPPNVPTGARYRK